MSLKMIAGLVLAMVCGAASAQVPDYESQEARLNACQTYGSVAALYWTMQKQGKTPTMRGGTYMEPVRAYIEKTIYEQPERYPDEDSARRMGWTNCMDNIQRLARDHKAGLN